MVLQVGDKVLVYGAGTPWAYAKKIEPVKVGDKVDVVTLSDGTKLSMPRISLNTDDYVWVIPTWDLPFNIGDIPFSWETIPLGAAVFTLTDIIDCWHVKDALREWDDNQIAGCLMLMLSGDARAAELPILIVSNSANTMLLAIEGTYTVVGYSDWTSTASFIGTDDLLEVTYYGPWYIVWQIFAPASLTIPGAGKCEITWKFRNNYSYRDTTFSILANDWTVDLRLMTVQAASILTPEELSEYGLWPQSTVNPDFPDYTTTVVDTPLSISNLWVGSSSAANVNHYFSLKSLKFYPEDCITEHLAVGDKYVIYDPVTKRLIFNDSTKLLTAANWVTGGTGAEISSSPIEYVWDGQGHVYLTQNKTTFSTIQFDDMLQVQAVHGETVRTIPMHLGERIAVSGETVSRELTNISSILRAGKNTITLTAKNQDGTKVGFVTAVYVKRNMTAVSL